MQWSIAIGFWRLLQTNQKAHSLKEESIDKAMAQAKKSIENLRFTEARETYSALLQLSKQEPNLPLTSEELKEELEKLEFTVYPVIHDHLLGSCKGYLRFNAYVISFAPAGDSRDDFTEPFGAVTLFAPGDRLKMEIRVKSYHFESNAGSKEANRRRVRSIFEDLKRRMAK